MLDSKDSAGEAVYTAAAVPESYIRLAPSQPRAPALEPASTGPLPAFECARRIVIKIGSALIAEAGTGEVRTAWLHALAEDVRRCRHRGQEVLIVSSGAVALGRHMLGLCHGPLRPSEKQAAAALGQVVLTQAFQAAFARQGLRIGQVLLSSDDTESRDRHLNARSMLNQLLALGVVPLVNENDATACDGTRVGDNDRLSARIAQMLRSDMLVLLSDVDGLYTADPRADAQAQFISVVHEITPAIRGMAAAAQSSFSSGGMITKLVAAQIAMKAGCHTMIANGREPCPLTRIALGARATWFKAQSQPRTGRKAWIAGALKTAGVIVADSGACLALRQGKSLLPAGVIGVEGRFRCGDIIAVCNRQGAEVARGIATYSSQDAGLIAGHRSHVFGRLLGFKGPDEIIHCDNLVLTGAAGAGIARRAVRAVPKACAPLQGGRI